MESVWMDGLRVGALGYEGHGTIGPYATLNGKLHHITAKHIFPLHLHEKLSSNSMDYCCIPCDGRSSKRPVELWDGDLYDPVTKIGSASGHTTGYIDLVEGGIAKVRSHAIFAEAGDSGAAVVTVRSGQLVGILVGGTKSCWDVLLASEIQADIQHTRLQWFIHKA